jgi:hypothetical protein
MFSNAKFSITKNTHTHTRTIEQIERIAHFCFSLETEKFQEYIERVLSFF